MELTARLFGSVLTVIALLISTGLYVFKFDEAAEVMMAFTFLSMFITFAAFFGNWTDFN